MVKFLSVCMIVKNEEDNLPRCLRSVTAVADEVVVVDTGSSDRTVEVAESFGASLHRFPWNGDFSAARNFSLAKASGQWVFILDADEELEPADRGVLRQLLATAEADGLYVNCINHIEGDAGPELVQYPQVRLFRNRPEYRFEGVIHEQIIPAMLRQGARFELSPVRINHYGYLKKSFLDKGKIRRNIEIVEAALRHKPRDSFMLFNLGMEYMRLGEYAQAVYYYSKSFSCLKESWAKGHAPVLVRNLCIALDKLGRHEDVIRVLDDAEKLYEGYTDLVFQRGLALFHLGRFGEAEEAFRRCLRMGEAKPGYLSMVGVGGTRPRLALGQIYERIGEYEKAVREYTTALKQDPRSMAALRMLASILFRFEPVERVDDFFARYSYLLSSDGLMLLAGLFARNRRYETALHYMDMAMAAGAESHDNQPGRAGATGPREEVLLLQGECLLMLGRFAEARRAFAGIAPQSRLFVWAKAAEAFSHAVEGDLDSAWRSLQVDVVSEVAREATGAEGLAGIGPTNGPLFICKALLHALAEEPFPEPLFDTEEDIAETETAVWRMLAWLLELERFEAFEKSLALLRLLPRREAENRLNLGKLYYRYGFRDSAFEELAAALEEGVYDHDGLFALAGLCSERGYWEDAVTFYYRCIGLNPKGVASYVSLSRILHEIGRQEEAEQVLDMGLREVPGSGLIRGMKQALVVGA